MHSAASAVRFRDNPCTRDSKTPKAPAYYDRQVSTVLTTSDGINATAEGSTVQTKNKILHNRSFQRFEPFSEKRFQKIDKKNQYT